MSWVGSETRVQECSIAGRVSGISPGYIKFSGALGRGLTAGEQSQFMYNGEQETGDRPAEI